ncbi:hypothetical protein AVEN_31010-1 [Araneus ventricosus]|uniref:HAT C-terminal dimerisation domain-containing protein n=1 Tax=Araneus ventricosus TaxID=182803 RepID=A0A4Y2UHG2_ARAVE|nr:hypothetical protein AVEN_31010-1 [Araneus ventricosus]
MSEKKKQSGTFYRRRKARTAAENEKQASILKKIIKIENIESREGLSTTVEGRSLTPENFKNDSITYCSNQEQKVPVNSTPQDQMQEHAKLQLLEPEAVEHLNVLSDCEESSNKQDAKTSLHTENTDNSTESNKIFPTCHVCYLSDIIPKQKGRILLKNSRKPLKNYAYLINLMQYIFLTLPVTVATGGRSFSKLIKTYLRSSMSQERLVGVATISSERDLL